MDSAGHVASELSKKKPRFPSVADGNIPTSAQNLEEVAAIFKKNSNISDVVMPYTHLKMYTGKENNVV